MTCTTKNCNGKLLAKGFCTKCYYRIKRGGTPEMSKRQKAALRICEVASCGKSHKARGLCATHLMQKRRAENPNLAAQEYERLKVWRASNPDKLAAQQARKYIKQKDALKAYCAQWKKDNRESYNAYLAQRKKRVRQATPSWADMAAIRAFYEACPKGYHVDHIIPLNGKNVSGLHIIENLQYLPAIDNLKKSNKVP